MSQKAKHFLIFLLMCVIAVFTGTVTSENIDSIFIWIIPVTFLIFFLFNSVVRYQSSFKMYFIHPFNIFTSKFKSELTSDISKELMFLKIIEVMQESDLKIKNIDNEQFEIFAISGLSIWSWGENVYIDFDEVGGETVMRFYATTIFGLSSWGLNKEHSEKLMQNFDDALTI